MFLAEIEKAKLLLGTRSRNLKEKDPTMLTNEQATLLFACIDPPMSKRCWRMRELLASMHECNWIWKSLDFSTKGRVCQTCRVVLFQNPVSR